MSEWCARRLRVAQLLLQATKNQIIRFRSVDLVSCPLRTGVYPHERHPCAQLGIYIM